jgi:hypothetical protein
MNATKFANPALPGWILGAAWLMLGGAKLFDLDVVSAYVQSRWGLSSGFAYGIVAVELAIGATMLVPWRGAPLRLAVLVSVLASLALLVLGATDSSRVPCGCFGSAVQATHARRLAVAGALLFLSATVWTEQVRHRELAKEHQSS